MSTEIMLNVIQPGGFRKYIHYFKKWKIVYSGKFVFVSTGTCVPMNISA